MPTYALFSALTFQGNCNALMFARGLARGGPVFSAAELAAMDRAFAAGWTPEQFINSLNREPLPDTRPNAG